MLDEGPCGIRLIWKAIHIKRSSVPSFYYVTSYYAHNITIIISRYDTLSRKVPSWIVVFRTLLPEHVCDSVTADASAKAESTIPVLQTSRMGVPRLASS
jgi:hypothetical protein